MRILKKSQYNQGIGKFKLLSSTSGVGSIITTKLGYYILISDLNKWNFVKWSNARIAVIRKNFGADIYKQGEQAICARGLEFIDDRRFVYFLRTEKQLENLVCLVGIPHMSLNEIFNSPNWKNHPIRAALKNSGEPYKYMSNDYMISASHFPKWFKNSDGLLKKIDDWADLFKKECEKYPNELRMEYFAPPRDASKFVREISTKNEESISIKIREYRPLDQTNMVLICPNGHLSDIPWASYLRYKTEKFLKIRGNDDYGDDLLSLSKIESCCGKPSLKWTESKTKSEGYASVFLECLNCKLGSNETPETPKISLEGINSLQPICKGEKPWEKDTEENGPIPVESCFQRGDAVAGKEKMKVALVTSNNVYYANAFSSLYIPSEYLGIESPEVLEVVGLLEKRYEIFFKKNSGSREQYWHARVDVDELISDNGLDIQDVVSFEKHLKNAFLLFNANQILPEDLHEEYRWQEYSCFRDNSISNHRGLIFSDIEIPSKLAASFSKIQRVDELSVTNVQLDFSRVKPQERIVVDGVVQEASTGMNTFSVLPNELFVLPANRTRGEGIFFEFSLSSIQSWIDDNWDKLSPRFHKILEVEPNLRLQGASISRRIYNDGAKHFLVHTFSHLMMRELEFTCGYPTASLKERLYISGNNRCMSGVLIYTTEGSEGSMGGLISQTEPIRLLEIIEKALERAVNCSSDPLCWESDGQGIFDLNLSACFSCSLVSETACEQSNLGLDRRVLIDEDFGFFRGLV